MNALHRSGTRLLCPLAAVAILAIGCTRAPVADAPNDNISRANLQAAEVAMTMVGKPYRYGGNSVHGFDCSGLVYFSFKRAGINVPRSTESQRLRSRKVATTRLARGDLVFFNQEGKYSSHVGIYLGNNRFVHAPSSGKRVRVDAIDSPYWRRHLVDARRF